MVQTYDTPAGTDAANGAIKTTLPGRDDALRSLFSGASAPANPVAYMLWADTATKVVKQRNAANSAWVDMLPLGDTLRNMAPFQLAGALATGEFQMPCLQSLKVLKVLVVPDTTTTGSSGGATDWTVQLRNVTAALDMFSTAFSTGTTELTADTVNELTPDQNQDCDAGDVLRLTIGKNGTPTAVADVSIYVTFSLVGI